MTRDKINRGSKPRLPRDAIFVIVVSDSDWVYKLEQKPGAVFVVFMDKLQKLPRLHLFFSGENQNPSFPPFGGPRTFEVLGPGSRTRQTEEEGKGKGAYCKKERTTLRPFFLARWRGELKVGNTLSSVASAKHFGRLPRKRAVKSQCELLCICLTGPITLLHEGV